MRVITPVEIASLSKLEITHFICSCQSKGFSHMQQGNPTGVNCYRRWRKHLDKRQGFIHQICRSVDSLANAKYLMRHWPSASEHTSILNIIEPV